MPSDTHLARQNKFLEGFSSIWSLADLDPQILAVVHEIAQDHFGTLTTNLGGYLSLENEVKLSTLAGQKWAERLRQKRMSPLLPNELLSGWHDVVVDFFSSSRWGIPVQPEKPQIMKEARSIRQIIPYILVAIASLVLLKMIGFFSDSESSQEGDPHGIVIAVGLLIFLCSIPIAFALPTRKRDRD